MIQHYSSIDKRYRWGVSTYAYNHDQVLVGLESDIGFLSDKGNFCRVRLTPDDAIEFAEKLISVANEIKNKDEQNNYSNERNSEENND